MKPDAPSERREPRPLLSLYLFLWAGLAFAGFVRARIEEQRTRIDTRGLGSYALREEEVGPPYEPDGVYGMAKLAAELTLAAMGREHGIGTASCRYFTVYGPRNPESHALTALIARAFVGADPFEIWGTGEQRRNWTHVDDIVRGTVAAAERLTSGAVNLGESRTWSVREAAELVLDLTGHEATIVPCPDKPVGPLNRAADGTRAERLLGFVPEVAFASGLESAVDWYHATHDREQMRARLDHLLSERADDGDDV